jgi:SWI/SNF-related matrix-associated actin-dependent regulator of chromatin subfamily A member 5
MDDLLKTGFTDWSKQEFLDFIAGSEKFGRDSVEQIAEFIKTKNVEDVKAYRAAFWQRIHELADKEKYVKQIERGIWGS